jgi:universal stress protein A
MPGYQKLLVVLDLSDDSEQVAVAARDLAAYSKAEIVALHVVEFVPVEPMGESLMPTVRLGFEKAKLRVEAGNIKAEILRVADEEGADLVVVGSRERHGLAILVNFTEDAVLHAARCDVLAVRLR